MIDYLIKLSPLIIGFAIWAVRLEIRLAKIETNILWIKTEIPKCQRF